MQVDIAGVPATGLIDTGADITIMGPELFKKVATVAGLKDSLNQQTNCSVHTITAHPSLMDGLTSM